MKIKMNDGSIREADFEEELGRNAFRHTTAHILAQAVKRLYPNTKCAIGPAIADGFYYDFDFDFNFSEDNFAEIEAEMKNIVKHNLQLKQFTADRQKALSAMEERNETYKIEMLNELPEDEEISLYQQGEYLEMCTGPHVAYTSAIKAFKLLSVAGAYWRGDEKNKTLTRIYGTSFPSMDMLEDYLNRQEEAKKRDHRKLGKELGLFALLEEGPGFPFFLPKGLILKNLLIDYWRKIHTREGYVEVSTPMMLNRQLWETSGHWEHYKEKMYTTVIDATEIEMTLKKEGLRCEIDGRAEKIGYKIRVARLERIPYMLVVGEKEVENNSVSVRKRDDGDLGNMPVSRLLEILREEGI